MGKMNALGFPPNNRSLLSAESKRVALTKKDKRETVRNTHQHTGHTTRMMAIARGGKHTLSRRKTNDKMDENWRFRLPSTKCTLEQCLYPIGVAERCGERVKISERVDEESRRSYPLGVSKLSDYKQQPIESGAHNTL